MRPRTRAKVWFSVILLLPAGWLRAQTAQQASPDAISAAMDSLLDFSTAAVQPAEPVETNRVKLVHKQALALRDPFWPVGYTPPRKGAPTKPVEDRAPHQPAPQPEVVERPPKWDEALRTVTIKGIMSVGEGKYMAVVNDQVVSENDTVSITFENRRYSWKIVRIAADGVKFQKISVSK